LPARPFTRKFWLPSNTEMEPAGPPKAERPCDGWRRRDRTRKSYVCVQRA
jgi:hypothetical protein